MARLLAHWQPAALALLCWRAALGLVVRPEASSGGSLRDQGIEVPAWRTATAPVLFQLPAAEQAVFDAVKAADADRLREAVKSKLVYLDMVDQDGRTALMHAATLRDEALSTVLLDAGARATTPGLGGLTPLHCAAAADAAAVARLLLRRGADIRSRAADGRTPLHLAAAAGGRESVEALVEQGAEVDARDGRRQTPLHLAAAAGAKEVAVLLLQNGAVATVQDALSSTPLHEAATAQGGKDLATLLLDAGAKAAAADSRGQTALHAAAVSDASEFAAVLLARGAPVDAMDLGGETPLHEAARRSAKRLTLVLLDSGAGINARSAAGQTPLHVAAAEDRAELAAILLSRGASIDATDGGGATPLHAAAQRDAMASSVLLLDSHAAANTKDAAGSTPLHHAARQNAIATVSVLVSRGASMDAKNTAGDAPLHLAAAGDAQAAVLALLDQGAAVDIKDARGKTPAHRAAAADALASLALLLERRADLEARSTAGETPLLLATASRAEQTALLLLREGALATAADKDGNTPLHHAVAASLLPLARALLNRGASLTVSNEAGRSPADLVADGVSEEVATLLAGKAGWTALHWAADSCDLAAAAAAATAQAPLLQAAGGDGRTPLEVARSSRGAYCEDVASLYAAAQRWDEENTWLWRSYNQSAALRDVFTKASNQINTTVGCVTAVASFLSVFLTTLVIRLNTFNRSRIVFLLPGLLYFAAASAVAHLAKTNLVAVGHLGMLLGSVLLLAAVSAKCCAHCRTCLVTVKRRGMELGGDLVWKYMDLSFSTMAALGVAVVEATGGPAGDSAALGAALALLFIDLSAWRDSKLGRPTHGMLRGLVSIFIWVMTVVNFLRAPDAAEVAASEDPLDTEVRMRVSPAPIFMACSAFIGASANLSSFKAALGQKTSWLELGAVQESKFVAGSFKMGRSEQAAAGLTKTLGLSSEDLVQGIADGIEAMRREVLQHGDREDAENFEYISRGTSLKEEDLPSAVAQSLETGVYHGGSLQPEDFDTGHGGRTLEDWMRVPEVQDAGLTEAEFVAVRFYTSSSFPKINKPLREGIVPHPWAMVVFFLDAGIKKLRGVQAKNNPEKFAGSMTLWRGMKNLHLDVEEFKRVGGTELAPMSTTASEDVAKHYAASQAPLIFKYAVSGLRAGVSIRFCSLYPKEEEYLYPPLTYMSFKRQYDDDGLHIVVVEPVMS